MPSVNDQNTTQQPADYKLTAGGDGANNVSSVTELRRREAEEKVKLASQRQQEDIEQIQKKLRSNKLLFYGFPVAVIAYGTVAIVFAIVPSIQTFFQVDESLRTLDRNIQNLKVTADNLQVARTNIADYDKYDTEVTSYIPSESQLGNIITVIQTKAGDFGLESKVAVPDADSVTENSTVENIADRDENDNALLDSINSGEIEFTPDGIVGAEGKLLAFDVSVQGKKDSFFSFLEEMEKARPIINLVFIDFQDAGTDTSSTEQRIRASLRFESYTLQLAEQDTQLKKYDVNDPELLLPIEVEDFAINPNIIEEFKENFQNQTLNNQ